ncbi:hypothetical protein DY000_02023121 [Brassica cretica]|uniref:Uncharacterized protein n=1 Tax=Brassica cretica TaxID=69181 RepID=A0ABQ7EIK7_BRACR|nr:hypothetical protein DY000_02023121 [Brassica cretica]
MMSIHVLTHESMTVYSMYKHAYANSLAVKCAAYSMYKHAYANSLAVKWALGPWTTTFDSAGCTSIKAALMTSYSWKVLPPYGLSINAFPWLCWFICTSRNQLIFENKPSTAPEIVARAIIASREWEQAQIHFDAPTAPKISLPGFSLDFLKSGWIGSWKRLMFSRSYLLSLHGGGASDSSSPLKYDRSQHQPYLAQIRFPSARQSFRVGTATD